MCAFTIPPPRRRGGRQPPTGRSLGVITHVCHSAGPATVGVSLQRLRFPHVSCRTRKRSPVSGRMDVWSPPVKRRVRAAMLGFPPDDRWHGRSFAPRGDFLFDDTRQSVGGEQLQRHVGHGWRKLSVITVLRGMNSIVQQPLTIEGKVEGRIFF
jgi:hypothetical protein